MASLRLPPVLALLQLLAGLTTGSLAAEETLIGFTPASSAAERELEKKFDAAIKRDNLREWMKRMSARPHHLGSAFDKDNAEFMAGLFRSWGYKTEIETFQVLFPTPKVRVLEMLEPVKFKASLTEPALPEDSTSSQLSEQLPVYNAYSVDGDVTAEIVYVNYGVPKDYEILAQHGIDVRGKIVIARYGGSWRGIKPKVAAEHGAIGCVIYSDPRGDGYFQGDAYPKGAWRPEDGAQRGSVADMPLAPGDPLTPGVGATKNAVRLPLDKAPTLTKIPVLPISYADAAPLLKALTGPVAPEEWRGALPFTYHLGPGPTKARLKLAFNWDQATVYNVIARMEGAERPDQWVIRGNHHDAWVNGASDPLSGMVCVLEEARAISELVKTGWKPKRTLIFAAWDGEEPGLLGSTEWVETHAEELKQHAAVYINTDGNERGFLFAGGSHTQEKFMSQIANDVIDPAKSISVGSRARANNLANAKPSERKELLNRKELRLEALGSGSDFTPFLQHAGIPSLNIGYGGEGHYAGVYHSIYDSFDHFTRFVDPGFLYGETLVKTTGRAVLRHAGADLLPFEFTSFSEAVGQYLKEVDELAKELREEASQHNQMLEEGVFDAASDPAEKFVNPPKKASVPFLNISPVQNALLRLQQAAREHSKFREAFSAGKSTLTLETQKAVDAQILSCEQQLLADAGLPRRPWYKHQIYAPGFYTGYSVKTLPGLREALEQKQWAEAEKETQIIAEAIERFTAKIAAINKLSGSKMR